MAGSAIVARLQLDSKDYDKKLAEAKKKTSDFAKGGGAGLGDMVGKFKTLAVAVAGSKAAMEVFNGVVQSSQTLGDKYTRVVEGMKSSVDQFFYSIGSGDWTAFFNGLDDVIAKSKAAATALDNLGTYDIALGYFRENYQTGFKESVAAAKDTKKSDADRKAAAAAAANYADEYTKALNGKEALVRDAFAKLLSDAGSNIDASKVNIEQFEKVLEDAVIKGNSAMYSEDYKEYQALMEKKKKLEDDAAKYAGYARTAEFKKQAGFREKAIAFSQQAAEIEKQLQAEKYQNAQMYNAALERWTDDELKGNLQILSGVKAGRREIAEMNTALIEVNNTMAKLGQTAATVASKTKELKTSLTGEQYAQHFGIGFYENLGKKGSIGSRVAAAQRGEMATIHEDVPIIDTTLEEEDPLPALTKTTENLKAVEDQTYSSIDAINALGGSMKALSGLVGEDAAAWVDWGANLVSAIAAAIPQIAALTAAKSTEATANTAAAASGAGSAVASIPVVGPIMAVAAIASVVAALANLPKFATGGVVPGNMMSGDNVLIRANSGEVVLNKQQQDILSNRLNGGMNGKVVFKIEGSTLVGVLNNNQKIASRNYGA